MNSAERNYYAILQVDQNASAAVIQGAYRALLKNAGTHPDLGGSVEATQLINEAYEVLSNPTMRQEYDDLLNCSAPIDSAPSDGELAEKRHVLICPSCRNRNELSPAQAPPEGFLKLRCGACGKPLLPKKRAAFDEDDEQAFRLGIFLYDKRLYERAQREFESAIRSKPRHALYHYWLGRTLYQRKQLEKSRGTFYAASLLEPGQFHFQFWLGQTQYALRDFSGAAQGFSEAARLRPGHIATLLKLGSCYFRLHRYDDAVATLEKALALAPDQVQPHLWLGLSHLACNQPQAALLRFEQAKKLNPADPTIKKYIRICQER